MFVSFSQPLMPLAATGSLTGIPTTSVRDRLVLAPNPLYDPSDPSSRPAVPLAIDPTVTVEWFAGSLSVGTGDVLAGDQALESLRGAVVRRRAEALRLGEVAEDEA